MHSEALINAYLESMQELTLATSINLYFPASLESKPHKRLIIYGDITLPEFSDPAQLDTRRALSEASINASGCQACYGIQEKSVLVELRAHAGKTQDSQQRRKSSAGPYAPIWLGLYFEEGIPGWVQSAHAGPEFSLEDKRLCKLFNRLVDFGGLQLGQLHSQQNLLVDPLTNLPLRTKFQSQVNQLLQQHRGIAILLIHSGDFHQINKKFGHESGDIVISEMGEHLRQCVRETDLISRFGGALFAVAIAGNHAQDAMSMAEKIQHHLQHHEYLQASVRLGFDVGIAISHESNLREPAASHVSDVIHRADQALKVSQSESSPTLTLWQLEQMDIYNQRIDYIGGIFTADTATDYRNMLLLWDISNIIAIMNQFDDLLINVVQRLGQTFDFTFAGIIEWDENGHETWRQLYGINEFAQSLELDAMPRLTEQLVAKTMQAIQQKSAPVVNASDQETVFAAPLSDKGNSQFFICGRRSKFSLTNDTQMLFAALTKQLGRALNRTRLEEQLNRQLEEQKHALQTELAQLRSDLRDTSMLYRSASMDALMRQAKRAAATDTTTLIIGESGTGKERLVNALHKMGSRKDKPLIIVDCGAIPETLIESELFGHVKGAFTGAQNTSIGKVQEADGGTLMLDEIGELPLQMQTKLLRFVQEKHFTPVGGNKSESVDVKIIAVTNRELEDEVRQGNFRQDLFYRLNVLTLRTPPLRERLEDIPLLCKHFLNSFAHQFDHPQKKASEECILRMQQYPWPGNIRELENRLMQANLLTDSNTIEWQHLNIGTADAPLIRMPPTVQPATTPVPQPQHMPVITSEAFTPTQAVSQDPAEAMAEFDRLLSAEIERVLHNEQVFDYPLGKWLEEDLVALTYDALDHNVKHTSLRLGVSLSTLRRKVEKVMTMRDGDGYRRPFGWQHIEAALRPVAEGNVQLGFDCLAQLKRRVLALILKQSPHSMTAAAALLGVSEPTLYKIKKSLTETDLV